MKKTRLLSLGIAIVLVVGVFVGCAPAAAPTPPAAPPPPAAAPAPGGSDDANDSEVDLSQLRIGFAQDTLGQPWRAYQAESVRVMGEVYGINIEITDGMASNEGQIANIEDMVTRGLDLLISSPFQQAALTPHIANVYQSGIPVVLIDRGIGNRYFTSYISSDNVDIGRSLVDFVGNAIIERHGEPVGYIVVIDTVPGSASSIQRNEGVWDQLEQYWPGITVLDMQPAENNRALAISVMEDFLQAHDRIDGVISLSDESTMGAILAIEASGRRDEMAIVSINATMEALQAVIDGRIDLTVLYSNAAGAGVEIALQILRGERVPQRIILDPVLFTVENAAEFWEADRFSPDPMRLNQFTYIYFWEYDPENPPPRDQANYSANR